MKSLLHANASARLLHRGRAPHTQAMVPPILPTSLTGSYTTLRTLTTGPTGRNGSSQCRCAANALPACSTHVFTLFNYQMALCTFTVSFGSSSYTGGIQGTIQDLNISEDVAILGISLYVLGFALGYVSLLFLHEAPGS